MVCRCHKCDADTLKFKDTERIFISAVYTEDDEFTPISLPDTIVCQLRDIKDELVTELDVVATDKAKGLFTLSSKTPVSKGKYRADVLFYDGSTPQNGHDMPSDNFTIIVTGGVSKRSW